MRKLLFADVYSNVFILLFLSLVCVCVCEEELDGIKKKVWLEGI